MEYRIVLDNCGCRGNLFYSENRNPILLEEVGDCLLLFLGLFTYGLPSSRGGVYLRCGHLPAVLGMFTSGGAEIFMPDGMGCIPPVVSPTLGGSRFEYTSGGSCGRACNLPPKSKGHLPPVGQRCLPAVLTSTCGALGMFTSGGFAYTRRE